MSQGVECYSCLPKTAWPPTFFRVADIEVASEISFIDDINSVIATITDGNTNMLAINNDTDAQKSDRSHVVL